MRSPETVVEEWIHQQLEAWDSREPINPDAVAKAIADLLRARDAEHEALRREERDEAFTAGWMATVIYSTRDVRSVDDHEARREAFQAARRRAIEDPFAARRAAVAGAPGGAGVGSE